MTPELVAILAVGVALAGLILNGQNHANRRIDALEQRLEGRIDALEQQVNQRFDRLESRLAALEQRVARLEGVLDGLREALFSTRAS